MTMASVQNLSDIGPRGLVMFDGQDYYYVSEDAWRKKGPLKDPAPGLLAPGLKEVKAVVAQLKAGVYVNLDRLAGLEEDPNPAHTGAPGPWRTSATNIVFEEKQRLFQITREDMTKLSAGSEGDARVLVKRGAVVASIPANSIPSGTYCVLVNLASLSKEPTGSSNE